MKRLLVLVSLVLPLMAGCAASLHVGGDPPAGGVPACGPVRGQQSGDFGPGIVLIAQSVPSATQLPCIRALPIGWTFRRLEATDQRARYWLDYDRDGDQALRISLTKSCDITGATESASGHPGIRSYELLDVGGPGYHGDRFFLFPGGCVTHHFNLGGQNGAEALQALSSSLDFVSRAAVAQHVHRYSHGHFELDADSATGGDG
jgi:hypothetical protein